MTIKRDNSYGHNQYLVYEESGKRVEKKAHIVDAPFQDLHFANLITNYMLSCFNKIVKSFMIMEVSYCVPKENQQGQKATTEIKCPVCGGVNVIRYGISASKNQRYYCKDVKCKGKSFQLEHSYTGCKVGINEKIVAMAANASGIRDTSRVLGVSQKKVMSTLKKQRI